MRMHLKAEIQMYKTKPGGNEIRNKQIHNYRDSAQCAVTKSGGETSEDTEEQARPARRPGPHGLRAHRPAGSRARCLRERPGPDHNTNP